jgi:hypothetical protein
MTRVRSQENQTAEPRLVKFGGVSTDFMGRPLSGEVEVTFALYKQETDEEPLWKETQKLEVDKQGGYTALIGASSKEFLVSVLLQADGQFIGKTFLGTAAEGQEILLSLRWDQPRQRFVASSQAAGSVPILSFIPFSSPDAANDVVPLEFSMAKNFVLNSGVSTQYGTT